MNKPSVLIWVMLAVFGLTAGTSQPKTPRTAPQEIVTVNYGASHGTGYELSSLDIYPLNQKDLSKAPVVIFVHGGGWTQGDKSMVQKSASMASFFRREGIVLASVNFRLVGDRRSPGTTYKEQAADIVKAIRWIYDHADEWNGDKRKLIVLGYSSGAHLAALLGTDERYLLHEGLSFENLKGVISMDVGNYDIPRAIRQSRALGAPTAERNLKRIFGTRLAAQQDASPMHHIGEGKNHPPFLIIYANKKKQKQQALTEVQSRALARALVRAGGEAESFLGDGESHSSLVMDLGAPQDATTQKLKSFLAKHLFNP